MSERYEFAGIRDIAEKEGVADDLVAKVTSLRPLMTLSVLAGAFAEHQDAALEVRQEILATASAEIGLLEAALTTARAIVQTMEIASAGPGSDGPVSDPPIDAGLDASGEQPANDAPTTPRQRRAPSQQS